MISSNGSSSALQPKPIVLSTCSLQEFLPNSMSANVTVIFVHFNPDSFFQSPGSTGCHTNMSIHGHKSHHLYKSCILYLSPCLTASYPAIIYFSKAILYMFIYYLPKKKTSFTYEIEPFLPCCTFTLHCHVTHANNTICLAISTISIAQY